MSCEWARGAGPPRAARLSWAQDRCSQPLEEEAEAGQRRGRARPSPPQACPSARREGTVAGVCPHPTGDRHRGPGPHEALCLLPVASREGGHLAAQPHAAAPAETQLRHDTHEGQHPAPAGSQGTWGMTSLVLPAKARPFSGNWPLFEKHCLFLRKQQLCILHAWGLS